MGKILTWLRLGSPVGIVALFAAGAILLWPHPTSAQYVQNNLIDDKIFLNANSMTQSQIQSFLVNRGGYLARYQLVFDCASTGTASNNAYVAAGAPCGQTVYASTIIYYAAQVYGLNPQAIMATLQKEQSLITATNPTSSQLNFAMGYGCADSTGCANNSGFLHQVDDATWQFRINYERSWGNNSWWNSQFHYVCPGATKYYSTGLYPGRNVTFYDDYGTGYVNFVINNGSTASLYCYTPHAYPGSQREYYSGSYNFVVAFENWFGSTQPAVTITSPLQMRSSVSAGTLTGQSINFSFTLKNSTNSSQNIGSLMIAARDSEGNNYDFGLQPVTIGAGGSYTYSATRTFSTEDTYTFWITDYANGQWNDNYPLSGNISNSRRVDNQFIQSMPTVTQQPAVSSELRVGKSANVSFVVHNNSAQALSLGKLGLAIRDPQGANRDVGYDIVPSLAAGANYTYSKTFTPTQTGTYRMYITDTADGGYTWDETTFPAMASGQVRAISPVAKPGQTVVSGVSVSGGNTPRAGQSTTISFQVKNFGDTAVNLGELGVAIRDPDGLNRDPRWDAVTIQPGATYTYSVPFTFNKAGKWNVTLTSYNSSRGWNSVTPASESDAIVRQTQVDVASNPTVTGSIAISPAQPRVGQAATITYTLKNFSNTDLTTGLTGAAVRDAAGANRDAGWVAPTISAGTTYTYSKQVTFTEAGTAQMWVSGQKDGRWNDNSILSESNAVARSLSVTVLPSPTITQSLGFSTTPTFNQSTTISFQVKNFGDTAVNLGELGVAIRDPDGLNRDPRWDAVTIQPGATYTYSVPFTFNKAGKWNVTLTSYRSDTGWTNSQPVSEDGAILRELTPTVN